MIRKVLQISEFLLLCALGGTPDILLNQGSLSKAIQLEQILID